GLVLAVDQRLALRVGEVDADPFGLVAAAGGPRVAAVGGLEDPGAARGPVAEGPEDVGVVGIQRDAEREHVQRQRARALAELDPGAAAVHRGPGAAGRLLLADERDHLVLAGQRGQPLDVLRQAGRDVDDLPGPEAAIARGHARVAGGRPAATTAASARAAAST